MHVYANVNGNRIIPSNAEIVFHTPFDKVICDACVVRPHYLCIHMPRCAGTSNFRFFIRSRCGNTDFAGMCGMRFAVSSALSFDDNYNCIDILGRLLIIYLFEIERLN